MGIQMDETNNWTLIGVPYPTDSKEERGHQIRQGDGRSPSCQSDQHSLQKMKGTGNMKEQQRPFRLLNLHMTLSQSS